MRADLNYAAKIIHVSDAHLSLLPVSLLWLLFPFHPLLTDHI